MDKIMDQINAWIEEAGLKELVDQIIAQLKELFAKIFPDQEA